MNLTKYNTDTLQKELSKVNEWLEWSASLVSKKGGWMMWNGDKEDKAKQYAREIKKEIDSRKTSQ